MGKVTVKQADGDDAADAEVASPGPAIVDPAPPPPPITPSVDPKPAPGPGLGRQQAHDPEPATQAEARLGQLHAAAQPTPRQEGPTTAEPEPRAAAHQAAVLPAPEPNAPELPPPAATPLMQPPAPHAPAAAHDAALPSAPPPPPTSQVAAAIAEPVQVNLAAPAKPGAAQTLTIQLKPVELGRVEVRIERSAEGPTRIELAVERTDTLMLLLRDQPALQHALDQAGVPQDGRTVQFSLSPAPSPASAPGADSGSSSFGGGRSSYGQPGYGGSRGGAHDPEPAPARGWPRSAVDITA